MTCPLCGRFGKIATDGEIADIGEAGFLADGKGLGAAEFHAVISAWIMGGGNHDTGSIVELADGEIEAIGGGHAQFDSVDPCR